MPIYTVELTVEVATETQKEAYRFIANALKAAKEAELVLVNSEVMSERPTCDK